MDTTFPMVDSDNESSQNVLEIDTDYDLSVADNCPATTTSRNIGSVWRDLVVGEQIEGSLTRLEVTTKKAAYTDMDDPNYIPMKNRKRSFSSTKSKHFNANMSDEECDLESEHMMKKKYSLNNGDFTNCNNKNLNQKQKKNESVSKNKCRVLPAMFNTEEMTDDQFLKQLCKNLHEHNETLMLSVISKIDRKIILEKYNKTCLIEANGGQMIKKGDRRRTSGGIFCNLIKEDKSIPNSAKRSLFGNSQNEEIKKKKKREKIKRRKEKLKKARAQERKEDDALKQLSEESELLPMICENKDSEMFDSPTQND